MLLDDLTIPIKREDKIDLLALLNERQIRTARTDFLTYVKRTTPGYIVNWHHREIANALTDVALGRTQLLEIVMPPRYGKSELVSRRFPAWYLGSTRRAT